MLNKGLEEVARLLDQSVDESDLGEPMFTDSRYTARGFDTSNFKAFGLDPGEGPGRLCFIDGGNLEILRAPNISVSLVRTFYNIFDGKRRLRPREVPERMEFFVVATARMVDGDLRYSALLVPLNGTREEYLPTGEHLMVNSMDSSLAPKGSRADISVMGSVTRRFAEWLLAAHVMEKELSEGDILVRDGTLQTAMKNEMYYARRAFEEAVSSGTRLTGLAKTSTLFTTTGHPLVAAVNSMSVSNGLDDRCWYYHPVVDNDHPDHPAEIFVCRLHERSDYVFRFEMFKDPMREPAVEDVRAVFEKLAGNSRDLSFLGYPYGLVDADANARVQVSECEMLSALCRAALVRAGVWNKVKRCTCAMSAHDVLDTM